MPVIEGIWKPWYVYERETVHQIFFTLAYYVSDAELLEKDLDELCEDYLQDVKTDMEIVFKSLRRKIINKRKQKRMKENESIMGTSGDAVERTVSDIARMVRSGVDVDSVGDDSD